MKQQSRGLLIKYQSLKESLRRIEEEAAWKDEYLVRLQFSRSSIPLNTSSPDLFFSLAHYSTNQARCRLVMAYPGG